jgi:cold shock CspA family protein
MQTTHAMTEETGADQPIRLRGFIDRISTSGGKQRNFGFVKVHGAEDHFIHRNSVSPSGKFARGTWVEFTSVTLPGKNPQAIDVKVIG